MDLERALVAIDYLMKSNELLFKVLFIFFLNSKFLFSYFFFFSLLEQFQVLGEFISFLVFLNDCILEEVLQPTGLKKKKKKKKKKTQPLSSGK